MKTYLVARQFLSHFHRIILTLGQLLANKNYNYDEEWRGLAAMFWWWFAASVGLLLTDDNLFPLTTLLPSGGFANQMSTREWTQLPFSIYLLSILCNLFIPAKFQSSVFKAFCFFSLILGFTILLPIILSFWLDRHRGLWSVSIIPLLSFKYLSIQQPVLFF